MNERIINILSETTGMDASKITVDMEFAKDLDINSVEFADVAYSCEEEFGIVIEEKHFRKIITVGDLIDYIDSINA